MTKINCYMCRDLGVDGGCPQCGKHLAKGDLTPKEELVEEDFNRLTIPKWYRGKIWRKEHLTSDYPEKRSEPSFNFFVNQIEKVHKVFEEGNIMDKSGIIIAPRRMSKMTWAYSCLQLADKNGFRTFPILDTQQMKRFLIMNEQRPFRDNDNEFGCSYEDFLMADILFMTVTKSYQYKDASQVIDMVLDIRSRYDRPTFVISRYSMKQITAFDRFETFKGIIDIEGDQNSLRYPVVLTYFDNIYEE